MLRHDTVMDVFSHNGSGAGVRRSARQRTRQAKRSQDSDVIDNEKNIIVDTSVAIKQPAKRQSKRRKLSAAKQKSKAKGGNGLAKTRKSRGLVTPGAIPMPPLHPRTEAMATESTECSTKAPSSSSVSTEPTMEVADRAESSVNVVSHVDSSAELAVPLERSTANDDAGLRCEEAFLEFSDDEVKQAKASVAKVQQPALPQQQQQTRQQRATQSKPPSLRARANSVAGPSTALSAPPDINDSYQRARRGVAGAPAAAAATSMASVTEQPSLKPANRAPAVPFCQLAPLEPTMTEDLKYSSEYALEILHHMFEQEEAFLTPNPLLGEVTPRMLSILVDWLVEVQVNFSLGEETLYLAVNILNRYVTQKPVRREELQLVGAASLLIASKHEEIYPPEVADFVYICADTYSKNNILEMECEILNELKFRLCAPSAYQFLQQYSRMCQIPETTRMLCQYLLELTLQEDACRPLRPSHKAAGAFDLGCRIMNQAGWTADMVVRCGYFQEDVEHVAQYLHTLATSHPPTLNTCRHKYLSRRYGGVAYVMYEQR